MWYMPAGAFSEPNKSLFEKEEAIPRVLGHAAGAVLLRKITFQNTSIPKSRSFKKCCTVGTAEVTQNKKLRQCYFKWRGLLSRKWV